MMVDLNRKYPNNIKILSQLGRMSIRTNQIDKAIKRFEQILALDPENKEANCTLADLFGSTNQVEKAQEYIVKCK
jgi:predicted Zn-dependent protease